MVGSNRAERRRRTRLVAVRRRERHLAWFRDLLADDHRDEVPLHRFARHYLRHRCGKRCHGRPKVGRGACRGPGLREAVEVRISSRRLARDLTTGRVDLDAC